MMNLKVKCSICNKEESNPEIIKEASEVVKKYGLKAEHYLNLLNLMSEKCLDSDEHSFMFDTEFLAAIGSDVEKYKENLTETEKLRNTQRELIKETDELHIKLKELKSKQESNEQRLQNIYENNRVIIHEVSDSTGCEDIKIWY